MRPFHIAVSARAARAACALAVSIAIATAPALPAFADDLGLAGGQASGSLGQVTQAVQQLSQTVQQLAQTVGNMTQIIAGSAINGIGSLFGIGGVGTPPLLGGGAPSLPGLPSLGGAGFRVPSFSPSSWLQVIQQILTSIVGQGDSYVADEWGAEWGMAPDYAYSSGTIAEELQNVASQLTGSGAQFLSDIASKLRSAQAPPQDSPQWASSTLASAAPDYAAQAHAVSQSQAGALSAQGVAQSAADKVSDIASAASKDTTPQDAAEASQAVANVTQSALASSPSTRSAVIVMGTALAEQQAEQAAQNAAIAARLDALLAQQAQLALQLSQISAGLSSVTGVEAQQIEKQLQDEATGAEGAALGMGGLFTSVFDHFNAIATEPQSGGLGTFIQSVRDATER